MGEGRRGKMPDFKQFIFYIMLFGIFFKFQKEEFWVERREIPLVSP